MPIMSARLQDQKQYKCLADDSEEDVDEEEVERLFEAEQPSSASDDTGDEDDELASSSTKKKGKKKAKKGKSKPQKKQKDKKESRKTKTKGNPKKRASKAKADQDCTCKITPLRRYAWPVIWHLQETTGDEEQRKETLSNKERKSKAKKAALHHPQGLILITCRAGPRQSH